MSFEKDLLLLKKMKNHEKHKNVTKVYHENEAEILSPNTWKKIRIL